MVDNLSLTRDASEPLWRVIGCSVRGASHKRDHLLNQDAILWRDGLCNGTAAILAVSDGHGSADHFRSHKGSKIAVRLAVEALHDVLRQVSREYSNLTGIRRDLEDRLPRQLVNAWISEIIRDFVSEPFTREELAALEERVGSARRQSVEARPQLAYGCTLIAVLVTQSFATYLQIGDGDILLVSPEGEVSRLLGRNPRPIANETASLCSPEAWRNVDLTVQAFYGVPPLLVLASTDGYSNSFVNDEAFLQVGRDLREMSDICSLDELSSLLEGWLNETSARGSGDDITLGIVKRLPDKNSRKHKLRSESCISF